MNIALLNVRIVVQANSVVTDGYGNRTNTWMPYLSSYATISGETPKEVTEAGQIVDDGRIDFTLRWCAAASVITTTGFRVLYRDELYNIIGVDHMNGKRKSVKLLCRKERR